MSGVRAAALEQGRPRQVDDLDRGPLDRGPALEHLDAVAVEQHVALDGRLRRVARVATTRAGEQHLAGHRQLPG